MTAEWGDGCVVQMQLQFSADGGWLVKTGTDKYLSVCLELFINTAAFHSSSCSWWDLDTDVGSIQPVASPRMLAYHGAHDHTLQARYRCFNVWSWFAGGKRGEHGDPTHIQEVQLKPWASPAGIPLFIIHHRLVGLLWLADTVDDVDAENASMPIF